MGPVESFVLASNRGHQQTAEAEDPARIQLQATAAEQQAKAEPPAAAPPMPRQESEPQGVPAAELAGA